MSYQWRDISLGYARFSEWRKGNGAKIIFLALSFYCVFGISNVGYFLPLFYAQTGFSEREAGILTAAFYISSVITRPLMGGIVPIAGFRRVFIVGSFLTVASSLGIAFAGLSFALALTARLCLGLGSSFFQLGLATLQAVVFKEEERGRAFSLIMAGGLAPMMTVVPLADWLLSNGYKQIYIMIPLLLCVAVSAIANNIPGLDDGINERIPRSGNGLAAFAECLKIPALRLALFSIFLFSITDAASAFMTTMTSSYGLMASYFLSSNAVVGVGVRLLLSRCLDRYPRWRFSAVIVFGMSALLFAASISPTRGSLIVLGLLFGVGMGFGFPLNLALISDYAPIGLQPQAVSLCWFLMGLNFALVPLITGWLAMFCGPVAAFRAVSLAVIAGGAYLAFLWNKLCKN